MSAIEQEILDRFRQLDDEAKARVIAALTEESSVAPMSAEAWLVWARGFRSEMQAKYGKDKLFGSVDLLHEAREDRLNDLMGRR
jgi:hypothetical protein